MAAQTYKNAFVTGASQRIGRSLALALAREGIGVAVHFNTNNEAALALVATLREIGVRSTAIQADLTSSTIIPAIIEQASRALGPIDCLINNAAIWTPSNLMTLDFQKLIEFSTINTMAPMFLIRAFADQTENGAVINLLDCRITDYDENNVAYHLSKRALSNVTRLAALTLAPQIRVNAIAPGLILPPVDGDEAFLRKRRKTTLLEKTGTVEDVTDAALFLLRSPFITGQTIFVDGGRNLKGAVY